VAHAAGTPLAKPSRRKNIGAGDASSVGEDIFVVGHAYLMHDRQVPMPSVAKSSANWPGGVCLPKR